MFFLFFFFQIYVVFKETNLPLLKVYTQKSDILVSFSGLVNMFDTSDNSIQPLTVNM